MAGTFLLSAWAATAHADSLSDLQAVAAQDSPKLAAAKGQWMAAQAAARGRGSLADPMVGANVERSGSTQFGDYMDVAYMLQQDLPWPGQRSAAKKVGRLLAESVGFAYLEAHRKVRSEVAGAFWELWRARQAVAVARDTARLADQMEATALARYEAGQSAQADVLRAQIERLRMRNEVVTMENESGVALARLNALLNADPATPRDTADFPPLPPIDDSLATLQEHGRQNCCVLMAAVRRREAKEAAVAAAKLERRPTFQARVEARQFKDSGDFEEYDTGLAVNVPWLWRGKYDAMEAEAKAELAMAEAEYDQELAGTLTEIQELFTEAGSRNRERHLYEDSIVPRTDQLVTSTRAAYQAGQVTALELLDAQRMRQDALLNWYRATAAYATAQAELAAITSPWDETDRATGLPPRDGRLGDRATLLRKASAGQAGRRDDPPSQGFGGASAAISLEGTRL